MPQDLSNGWIDRLSSSEMERVWDANFDRLVTTSIADAENHVRPEISRLLRSRKWRDGWSDALNFAIAELESSVERMTYEDDPRLAKTAQRVQVLRKASGEALAYLRVCDRETDGEYGGKTFTGHDAGRLAKKILRTHFRAWFEAEMHRAMEEQGLPRLHPFQERHKDGIALLEHLVGKSVLEVPADDEVHRLLGLSDEAFRNAVASDVADQMSRNAALRHPLLLNDWMSGLQDLQEITWSALGAEGVPQVNIPVMVLMPQAAETEIRTELRRRRFYRGVMQRMAEWRRVSRRLVREAVRKESELKRPWSDAARRISDSIPDTFPREYEAVRRALDAFGEQPGSAALGGQFTKHRREVQELIAKALQDGSWTKLLGN